MIIFLTLLGMILFFLASALVLAIPTAQVARILDTDDQTVGAAFHAIFQTLLIVSGLAFVMSVAGMSLESVVRVLLPVAAVVTVAMLMWRMGTGVVQAVVLAVVISATDAAIYMLIEHQVDTEALARGELVWRGDAEATQATAAAPTAKPASATTQRITKAREAALSDRQAAAAAAAEMHGRVMPVMAEAKAEQAAASGAQPAWRTIPVANAKDHIGAQIRLTRADGKTRAGRLSEISHGRLAIDRAGMVVYVSPLAVEKFEVLETL